MFLTPLNEPSKFHPSQNPRNLWLRFTDTNLQKYFCSSVQRNADSIIIFQKPYNHLKKQQEEQMFHKTSYKTCLTYITVLFVDVLCSYFIEINILFKCSFDQPQQLQFLPFEMRLYDQKAISTNSLLSVQYLPAFNGHVIQNL